MPGRLAGEFRKTALLLILFNHSLLLFFQKGNENAYRAPTSYYLVCLAVTVFFVAVARWLGRKQELAIGSSDVAAWRFACLGFLAILSFVFLLYGLPSAGGPAWVTALLLIALAATVAFLLTRWSDEGSRTLSTWQQYALVAGSYGAFALQAPFQEFNPARGSAASANRRPSSSRHCWQRCSGASTMYVAPKSVSGRVV